MVQIGELAYKTRFDGRELTKGLMSTRQQMAAAKKLAEDTRTPLDKYRTGLDNLAAMSQRYAHVAARQTDLSKQLEKQYLSEESAVRKLTKAERSRFELLQLPDKIKERAASTPSPAAARDAANRKRGQDFMQRRDAMFSGIDRQQADGRAALRERLAAFRQGKEDRRNNIGSSRAFNNMPLSGASGVGANFHTAGQRGDAPEKQSGGIGSGFAFGAKAFAGGFAAAKVVETTMAMRDFAKESQMVYTSLEKTQAAFDVFTGSSAKTQSIIASMKQLSALSGVTFSTMSEGAATMMSYGMSTESTTEKLKQLATISRGDSERFKMMALAFGQVTAAGRLMGQETLQLINAGFNPLAEISRTTGRSMADLKKDMENGLITVDMVSNAFKTATSEGGRYNGMLEKIGETTAGMQAKSSAAWEQAKADVGEALKPLTKWQASMSEAFAKSVSDMAAPWKAEAQPATPVDPVAAARDAEKKKRDEATARNQKAQDALAASIKTEQERQKAMMESGLASIPEMSLAVQSDSIKEEDMKKFERARSLMDEITKKQATIDFAENGDLAMVYSYLDKEVQKELEKIDALEQQNKLLAEQKAERDKNTAAGEALAEKNQTAAERYKKQLDDIAKLQDVGAIDSTTALRERLAVQKQMQNDLGQNVPQDLLAGSATAARSINVGSAEAAKYMDDLRALTDGSKTSSNDPQVKALQELNKKNDDAIAEAKRHTKLLEKMAETSPKKAR
jgi:tape measure domain-containing protein